MFFFTNGFLTARAPTPDGMHQTLLSDSLTIQHTEHQVAPPNVIKTQQKGSFISLIEYYK